MMQPVSKTASQFLKKLNLELQYTENFRNFNF